MNEWMNEWIHSEKGAFKLRNQEPTFRLIPLFMHIAFYCRAIKKLLTACNVTAATSTHQCTLSTASWIQSTPSHLVTSLMSIYPCVSKVFSFLLIFRLKSFIHFALNSSCPTHPIFLDLISLVIFCEAIYYQGVHPLQGHIFSNILKLCCYHMVTCKVSYP
jgi:hypothetical protein